MMKINWRGILAVLPLPTLALAASYGVWAFNSLYLPFWAAAASAASFELVYLGLAVAQLSHPQRVRAKKISYGAVGVSVVYNTLAGLFHRQPEWFTNLDPWKECVLALVHGAPLAIVAYLVSDLLIHQEHTNPETTRLDMAAASFARVMTQPEYPEPVQAQAVSDTSEPCTKSLVEANGTPMVKQSTYTVQGLLDTLEMGECISPSVCQQRIGASRSTVNRLIKEAVHIGMLARVDTGVYQVVAK
jgi:hypothetical protein